MKNSDIAEVYSDKVSKPFEYYEENKHMRTLNLKTVQEVERKILDGLELIKVISNQQPLTELVRRIKEKEIDWESIFAEFKET